jgi:hypothetical protein
MGTPENTYHYRGKRMCKRCLRLREQARQQALRR